MKALVLCSGGVDSTTCLAIAVERYGAENVTALSVSYGQKHSRELQAARDVADYYGVRLQTLDLAAVFEGSNCSLLSGSDQAIPTESYDEQLKKTNGAPVSTYVPAVRKSYTAPTATTRQATPILIAARRSTRA